MTIVSSHHSHQSVIVCICSSEGNPCRRMDLDAKKLFLKEILDRKEIIFGHYNNIADGKRKKREAWQEISHVLEANGCHKKVEDLRDVVWRNIRASTMKKVDNSRRRTGSAGGEEAKLNTLDDLVLAILGKDSAGVQGLPVTETSIDNPPPIVTDGEYTYTVLDTDCKKEEPPRRKRQHQNNGQDGDIEWEKQKLLVENLRLRNKKLRLEIKILQKQASDSENDE